MALTSSLSRHFLLFAKKEHIKHGYDLSINSRSKRIRLDRCLLHTWWRVRWDSLLWSWRQALDNPISEATVNLVSCAKSISRSESMSDRVQSPATFFSWKLQSLHKIILWLCYWILLILGRAECCVNINSRDNGNRLCIIYRSTYLTYLWISEYGILHYLSHNYG